MSHSQIMANIELDPLIRRGLRLLHSKSRDSTDQLRALLEESRNQRQGKSLAAPKDPFNVRRESPIPRPKPGSPNPQALIKQDQKRDLPSKLRDEDNLHIKRPRVESPGTFKCHTPSPTPSIKSESSSRSRKSEDSDSESDFGLSMDSLTDGINCCICKNFEIYNGNTLVECQECHLLYHQECHRPPINHQDISTDPRVVWYCAKCTRQMKKQTGIVSTSTTSSSSMGSSRSMSSNISGSNISSSSSSSSSKGISSIPSRPNPSPSKVSGMARPSPFTNLASASGRSIGSSNSSSTSSSSSGSSSSSSVSKSQLTSSKQSTASSAANSMLSAERRMLLMKKRAAAANRRNIK